MLALRNLQKVYKLYTTNKSVNQINASLGVFSSFIQFRFVFFHIFVDSFFFSSFIFDPTFTYYLLLTHNFEILLTPSFSFTIISISYISLWNLHFYAWLFFWYISFFLSISQLFIFFISYILLLQIIYIYFYSTIFSCIFLHFCFLGIRQILVLKSK